MFNKVTTSIPVDSGIMLSTSNSTTLNAVNHEHVDEFSKIFQTMDQATRHAALREILPSVLQSNSLTKLIRESFLQGKTFEVDLFNVPLVSYQDSMERKFGFKVSFEEKDVCLEITDWFKSSFGGNVDRGYQANGITRKSVYKGEFSVEWRKFNSERIVRWKAKDPVDKNYEHDVVVLAHQNHLHLLVGQTTIFKQRKYLPEWLKIFQKAPLYPTNDPVSKQEVNEHSFLSPCCI